MRSNATDLTLTYSSPIGRRESGITLVELMVSLTLGLLVVLVATGLLLATKAGYTTQDDNSRIDDTGRYIIESLSRAVRQAAYVNWDREQAPFVVTPGMSANILGLDDRRLKRDIPGIDQPVSDAVNGSDVLAVRFFGAGSAPGDGTMLNCAGFSVAAPSSTEMADESRGWSIYYVAKDSKGEPQLYCKYNGEKGWASDSIARGVESFQVLYGVDTDGDGLPNKMLTASGINALDATSIPQGATEAERNGRTHWKKVVTLKIALLVCGTNKIQTAVASPTFDLLGKEYSNAQGAVDKGVHLSDTDFSEATRSRMRRIYTTTVQLRNQSSGAGA